jgi:hypothetical protein
MPQSPNWQQLMVGFLGKGTAVRPAPGIPRPVKCALDHRYVFQPSVGRTRSPKSRQCPAVRGLVRGVVTSQHTTGWSVRPSSKQQACTRRRAALPQPHWGKPSTAASTTSLGAVWMLRAPGGRHGSPRPMASCVRPSPGVYGCLWGSCAEVRGSTGLHGERRRAPDGLTPRSEALFAVWQVQDSNLRRHTPTDLQSASIGRSDNLPLPTSVSLRLSDTKEYSSPTR